MSNPLTTPFVTYQAPLSMGFSRQDWSGLPFPSPEALPNTEIEPGPPALQTDSLLTELQGKPVFLLVGLYIFPLFFQQLHIIKCLKGRSIAWPETRVSLFPFQCQNIMQFGHSCLI